MTFAKFAKLKINCTGRCTVSFLNDQSHPHLLKILSASARGNLVSCSTILGGGGSDPASTDPPGIMASALLLP